MSLSLNQLLELCERGIVGKKGRKPLDFGFKGGDYLGSPGKDIYLSLSSLNEAEKRLVAKTFADSLPAKPPGNHVQFAAAIRYIYGCFEKQGTLRSEEDKERMIGEDPNWEVPFKFMEMVADRLTEKANTYGLVLHYEMLAHRLGDIAVIKKDPAMVEKMIEYYELSQKLAERCGSEKHMFTPFYWCARYLYETGDKARAVKYHRRNLKAMDKHCPDAREGYREKAISSIEQYKECSNPEDWANMKDWLSRRKNKCLRKVTGKFL